MRLFGIEPNGSFREYRETPFQAEHTESMLEDWLEQNPDRIVEDEQGLFMIGRQVTTNLGGYIDLLALDREGNVVVLELKRDLTPRDTLAQALEYASFARELDAEGLQEVYSDYTGDPLAELGSSHREALQIGPSESVTLNKSQRIVIVGQRIRDEIIQTSRYLVDLGLRVACLEFKFFEADDGKRVMATDLVLSDTPARRSGSSSPRGPILTEETFLEKQPPGARKFHQMLLDHARTQGWDITWKTVSYSLSIDLDGVRAPFCYAFDAESGYGAAIYSSRGGSGGLKFKVEVPDDFARREAEAAGILESLTRRGQDWRADVGRDLSEDEAHAIVRWVELMAERVGQLPRL